MSGTLKRHFSFPEQDRKNKQEKEAEFAEK